MNVDLGALNFSPIKHFNAGGNPWNLIRETVCSWNRERLLSVMRFEFVVCE